MQRYQGMDVYTFADALDQTVPIAEAREVALQLVHVFLNATINGFIFRRFLYLLFLFFLDDMCLLLGMVVLLLRVVMLDVMMLMHMAMLNMLLFFIWSSLFGPFLFRHHLRVLRPYILMDLELPVMMVRRCGSHVDSPEISTRDVVLADWGSAQAGLLGKQVGCPQAKRPNKTQEQGV